jgi:hypothetical protein
LFFKGRTVTTSPSHAPSKNDNRASSSIEPEVSQKAASALTTSPILPRVSNFQAACVEQSKAKECMSKPLKKLTSDDPVATSRGGLCDTKSSYQSLKGELLCKKSLFVDSEFPANDSSLYYQSRLSQKIEWKRPIVSA